MIKSRYSFTTWINLAFATLFLTATIVFAIKEDLTENTPNISIPNWLLILILLPLIAYLFYSTFKAAAKVAITNDEIVVKRLFQKSMTITKDDIREIKLFARGRAMGLDTITVRISLKNETIVKIADLCYSNMTQLRKAVTIFFHDKIISHLHEQRKSRSHSNKTKFAGNPLFNFNTLLFSGITVALLISTHETILLHPDRILFLLIPITCFFVIFGYQMYYFKIENNSFYVKNHFFPWINKEYNLDEIIIAAKESSGRKLSDALRIITKDLQSKSFMAGSLREKHWEELKKNFADIGIQTSIE